MTSLIWSIQCRHNLFNHSCNIWPSAAFQCFEVHNFAAELLADQFRRGVLIDIVFALMCMSLLPPTLPSTRHHLMNRRKQKTSICPSRFRLAKTRLSSLIVIKSMSYANSLRLSGWLVRKQLTIHRHETLYVSTFLNLLVLYDDLL